MQTREEKDYSPIPAIRALPFYLSVEKKKNGRLKLNEKELAKALPQMSNETLIGLISRADLLLENPLKNTNK
jgi:hypothetical protein